MQRLATLIIPLALVSTTTAQETIGTWNISAAPISATEIVTGGGLWSSINVINQDITIDEAFSGSSIIDDGYANGAAATTVEMTFAAGDLINAPGDDLVMFDARFSDNDYDFSSSHDGHVATISKLAADFTFTGEQRGYYYFGGGPYTAPVWACPIDLSDLGVPDGAAVTSVRFIATTTEVDPLGMGVICQGPCSDATNYCVSLPNSTGAAAVMSASGSTSIGANDLVLHAGPTPNQSGLFFFGPTQLQQPFGNGFLCVGSPQTRFGVQSASGNQFTLAVDNTSAPAAGSIVSGSIWNFQCWYRDPAAGGAFFNTSDGLQVTFTP